MLNPTFYTLEAYKSIKKNNIHLKGRVVHGEKIGRKINFPTANILIENQDFLPELGVYAVTLTHKNQDFFGMMNLGLKPTFNTTEISLEVHILNFDEIIYDDEIEITFVKFLRHQQKFNSLDELKTQLEADKQNVISLFNIKN